MQVSKAQRRASDQFADAGALFASNVSRQTPALFNLLVRLFQRHAGQIAEFERAAFAGLERFAILAIDRAEPQMLKAVLGHIADNLGGAEHLFEM